MKNPPAHRLLGADRVAELVKVRGLPELARKTRSAQVTVRCWANGTKRPATDARLALQKHYDVSLESWELPAERPSPAAKSNGGARTPAPFITSAKEAALLNLREIQGDIEDAKSRGAGPREISALRNAYSNAVRLYARVAGELELTEASIVRSSVWGKAMRLLEETLEPFPDAAKAVSVAFSNYGVGP